MDNGNLVVRKIDKIHILFATASLILFAHCISEKLVGGARWSSGVHLAGVDNWLYGGGTLYTVGDNGITPGSSYFPGVMILAVVFRLLFGYGAETAFVFMGGIFALLFVWGVSVIACADRKYRFLFAFAAGLFLVVEFPRAQTYLLELHPDIPALVCFLWGIIFLDDYLERQSSPKGILTVLLFFLSGLFKQNAISLYVGLAIYVLLSKEYCIKQKPRVMAVELAAGFLVLGTVLGIKGCWFNCVTVNSKHSFLGLKEYLEFASLMRRENGLYIILLCVFFILLSSGHIKLGKSVEKLWLFPSVCWTAFGMFGAAKEGANSGNMEAAVIALMPFVFILIDRVFGHLGKLLNMDVLNADIQKLKKSLLIQICVAGTIMGLAVVLGKMGYTTVRNYHKFQDRLHAQQEFAEWINENYPHKNIAYHDIIYEVLNNTDINKKSDLDTVCVWEMGKLVSDSELAELARRENWDVIITWPGLDHTRWPLTFAEFDKLDLREYPDMSSYYGAQVYVYEKKGLRN